MPTKSSQPSRTKATMPNSSSLKPKTSPPQRTRPPRQRHLHSPRPRQRPPHLPPHQRRRRRHPLAHRHRLVLLHHQRPHSLRHPRHLPLPIRPPHPLSRRPNRKLLHGQQTGSRLPPLTRRQTRNNRNHHRWHRKVCAYLGIRLVPVRVYL